ncbi:MAG: thermonuclease family protein [bacterium]
MKQWTCSTKVLLFFLLVITGCGGSPSNDSSVEKSKTSHTEKSTSVDTAEIRQTHQKKNPENPTKKSAFEHHGIFPTSVETDYEGNIKLTLNRTLHFNGLYISPDGLQWPENDAGTKAVAIHSKSLRQAMAESALQKKNQSESGELTVTSIQVEPSSGGPVMAGATALINGVLEIRGIKLLDTDDGYWLTWPSVKVHGEWESRIKGGEALRRTLKKQILSKLPDDIKKDSSNSSLDGRTSPVRAKVIKVFDGDTFKARLMDGTDREVYVRLKGINCPESKRNEKCEKEKFNGKWHCEGQIPYGIRAKKVVQNWLSGNEVILEPPGDKGFKQGHFDRLLAYVQMRTGEDLGIKLIKNGYCLDTSRQYSHPRGEKYRRHQEPIKPLK